MLKLLQDLLTIFDYPSWSWQSGYISNIKKLKSFLEYNVMDSFYRWLSHLCISSYFSNVTMLLLLTHTIKSRLFIDGFYIYSFNLNDSLINPLYHVAYHSLNHSKKFKFTKLFKLNNSKQVLNKATIKYTYKWALFLSTSEYYEYFVSINQIGFLVKKIAKKTTNSTKIQMLMIAVNTHRT